MIYNKVHLHIKIYKVLKILLKMFKIKFHKNKIKYNSKVKE